MFVRNCLALRSMDISDSTTYTLTILTEIQFRANARHQRVAFSL